MTRTARQPYEWLTMCVGLVAALVWASLGVRAIVMDHEPSLKALLACAALVLAGVALGSVTWVLTSEKRAKRGPGDAAMRAEMRATFAMLGLATIGLGANQIMDPSPHAWGLALMALASLGGGLNLSVAFLTSTESRSDLVAR